MKLVLSILLFFYSFNSFTQNCNCDKYSDEREQKFQELIDYKEFEKASKISDKYLEMKNINCQVIGLEQKATIYSKQFLLDSMKLFLDKEKKLLKKVTCNQNAQLEFNLSMAIYYNKCNDIQKGTNYYFKALKIADKLNNYDRQAYIYSSLIVSFGELGQYKRKLEYAQKSLQIIDKVQLIEDKVDIMNLVAGAYRSNYYRLNSYRGVDSIQILAKKMLQLSKRENYDRGIFDAYTLMSDYAAIKKNYSLSLTYLDSAEQLTHTSKVLNSPQFPYKIYFNKSFVYYEQKKYKDAARASDSLLYYSKMSNQHQIIAIGYEKCYEAYKALGNNVLALKYHELFKQYEDSAANETNLAIIEGLEQKYQKEQNIRKIESEKQKNKLLKKENAISSLNVTLLLIGIITSFLVILLIVLFFRQRNLKNKNDIIEIENRLNRSRMNPHFFFNALTSLQGIALNENGGKEVAIRLSQFSGLMRKTLDNTYSNFIKVEEEVAFLRDYLEVSKLRNKDFFNYNFIVEEELIHEEFIVPSMILQPFAENAIQHAFSKLKTGGFLEIELKIKDDFLEVFIRDNGPGITTSITNTNHVSRAITITKERLNLLQKKLKGNFYLEIYNRKNVSGVEVFIKLPLLLKHENIDN